MAEKQIPGDIYYDNSNRWFRDINGYVISDHDFVEQWDKRSDEFPDYWENTGVKNKPNFVLIADMGEPPQLKAIEMVDPDPVRAAINAASSPEEVRAILDCISTEEIVDGIMNSEGLLGEILGVMIPADELAAQDGEQSPALDIWVVRHKGEQTTIAELTLKHRGVERVVAWDVASAKQIDHKSYVKLWKFSISKVNQAIVDAENKATSIGSELRSVKNSNTALNAIVTQLEASVNPAKDIQITNLQSIIMRHAAEMREMVAELNGARKQGQTYYRDLDKMSTRARRAEQALEEADGPEKLLAIVTRERDQLQQMNDTQADTITVMRAQKAELKERLDLFDATSDAVALAEKNKELKGAYDNMEKALHASTKTVERYLKEANETGAKIKQLENTVEYLRGRRDEADVTISNLRKEAKKNDDKDTIERLSKSVAELSKLNDDQAERIRVGAAQLVELKIELRAKANLEKRVKDLTNDLLRTADERDNGVMEAVRARLPDELAKATKELSEEKSRLKEVEKETDIAHNREIRKLEKKIRKLKGALRAAANDIELVEELKDANTQLTERLSELSIRAARLEAGQEFLASVSIDEEERLSVVEAAGLHSSYDNFPTVHIHINGGVVNFASPIINQ